MCPKKKFSPLILKGNRYRKAIYQSCVRGPVGYLKTLKTVKESLRKELKKHRKIIGKGIIALEFMDTNYDNLDVEDGETKCSAVETGKETHARYKRTKTVP